MNADRADPGDDLTFREIIDAIGHRPAEFLDQEVVRPDLFWIALGAILTAIVTEVPDQLLLLGVDRDYRLLFGQSSGHLGVDVANCASRSGWLSPSLVLRLPCRL